MSQLVSEGDQVLAKVYFDLLLSLLPDSIGCENVHYHLGGWAFRCATDLVFTVYDWDPRSLGIGYTLALYYKGHTEVILNVLATKRGKGSNIFNKEIRIDESPDLELTRSYVAEMVGVLDSYGGGLIK